MLKLLREEADDNNEEIEIEIEPENKEVDSESAEEVPAELNDKACEDVVLSLVKEAWALISQVNGAIATLDYTYSKNNKEDIKNILNTLVDDLTIDVGMLYKVSDMMNEKTEKLLDAGAEKAEEVADTE